MNIGLLLPSLLMADRFADRIFAPKELFLALADGLVDRGHDVTVYSTSDTKTRAKLVGGHRVFEERTLPSVRVRKEQEDYTLFKLNYAEYELDLTTTAYRHAAAAGIAIMHSYHDAMAHAVSSLTTIPTVYTLHDPSFDPETLEGWRFDRFKDDAYVAISRRQSDLFSGRVRVVDVVYHGLDIRLWAFGEKPGEYLAFVGRFIAEKGVEDALSVSETLGMPIHLATSENYKDTTYYREVLAPRLTNPLFGTTGFLDQEGRSTWLKGARALLFPIHWEEPFGMVMIEAMACGTPVIAFNRGSVAEIVRDGVTGFIVDESRGVDGLVEAVRRIGEIDRAACRRHVEEHFTVEKMVEGYERVYESVLASKG